jgi:hypothetical protein
MSTKIERIVSVLKSNSACGDTGRHIACVVKHGTILSVRANEIGCHAEVAALSNARISKYCEKAQ